MTQTDFIQIGQQKGYIQILDQETTIHYVVPDKRYRFKDPEEQVRASYYVELIERYQYPEARIDLEVTVPRRTPSDLADIVVFDDDEQQIPYIVVECKKDELSEAEFSQAIEQAFGNCHSLYGDLCGVVAGNTRRFFEVKNHNPRERTQNIIADFPIGYGTVQEWRYKKGDPNWELLVVERTELIRALEKCHDTLWQGGRLTPTDAFDELAKLLFIKIQDEKKARREGEIYDFQIKTHERPESVAKRIKGLYQHAKARDAEVFTEDIEIDDSQLFSVVNHLQGINLNETDLDVKGVAFERFLGNFFKGEIGQYFTPRNLVEFMVKMVAPRHEARVLDPACGSGGFLLHALDYIRAQASDFYEPDTPKHYAHWHDFAEKRLFGIEVNDSIARVAKMNMIIHDDGHSNVIGNDALVGFDILYDQHRDFEKETFDLILTNPPFGAVVKKVESPYLVDYELGKGNASQKTEILFLERCFDFLKPGTGQLAIILPDGILTNSSLQYVRDYIEGHFQILAVVSLPQTAFSHYGAGVKTSILFLRKFSDEEYSTYQAALNRVKAENEAVYTPQIVALEHEQKSILADGCPVQRAVTEQYQEQLRDVLTNINELNRRLGKGPTKKIKSMNDRLIGDTAPQPIPKPMFGDSKTLTAHLKAHTADLTELEQEYREAFKASADSEWAHEVKAEYRDKIDSVKEELTDKNAEDIRQWIRENKNDPTFMAIAERIGYDATGRVDPINDLNIICDEYQRFCNEVPDFFG